MRKLTAWIIYAFCYSVAVLLILGMLGAMIVSAVQGDPAARTLLAMLGGMIVIAGFVAAFNWAAGELEK